MNTGFYSSGHNHFFQQRRNIVLGLESSNALGWTPHGFLLGKDVDSGKSYVIYGRYEMDQGCLGTIEFTGAEMGAYINREGSENVPIFGEDDTEDSEPEPED